MNKLDTMSPFTDRTESVENQRRQFALEALSKLTRQFAENPNFNRLANMFLLTILGQFGVRGAVLSMTTDSECPNENKDFSIGQIRMKDKIASMLQSKEIQELFLMQQSMFSLIGFNDSRLSVHATDQFKESGIELLIPMVYGNRLLGIIGLGGTVGDRKLLPTDLEMLCTLVDSVVPLLMNSLLFQEISGIGQRHLEVLNSIYHGIFVFDKAKQLKGVNESALQILGQLQGRTLKEQSILGQRFDHVFNELVFPNWLHHLADIDAVGKSVLKKKLVARGVNGDHVFNVYLTRLKVDSASSTSETVLTLDDITTQRDSETRLIELEKLAVRGELTAAIAHDLNNFIGMILGGIQLTQFAIEQSKFDKAIGYLSRLTESAMSMERFTASMTDSSRLNAQRSSCNLNNLVTDVLNFTLVQPQFRGIRIITTLCDDLPNIELDESQISQVLLNLLNNASDAVNEGGNIPKQIHIETLLHSEDIELIVSDNGSGMSNETKSKLFKTRQTTKSTGHGFGLVNCSHIIADHGGTISGQSELGIGSSFTITLPVGR